MADVGRRAAERGQLLLVTGLSLAILFVALALILNTAIYTENLATRSSDIGGGTDAVRYHDAARNGVGGAIDYANAHNNTSYSTLGANLSTAVDSFDNHSARLFASGDRAVETVLGPRVDGTRIAQTDPSRNATNESGIADWTVVEDVNATRAFTINVTGGSLEGAGTGDEFRFVLNDSSTTWVINVTSGSPPVIGITNGTGATFTCSGTSTPFIDVTAGTIDGEPCEGLELAEDLDTPYEIRIESGDNVTGTFSMVVDNDTLAGSPSPHLVEVGNGQPFAAHAIYSANLTVVYQTPRLYYNTTVRVAPGEPDG